MTGNVAGAVVSTASAVASQIGSFREASMQPNISQSGNEGDVNNAFSTTTFGICHMQATEEYIKIIDDYFSRYGYKINRVKTPNLTGRRYWNYVEIGSTEEIGYGSVPSIHMHNINNACRKGVTIWHSHDNIGSYTLDNSIS